MASRPWQHLQRPGHRGLGSPRWEAAQGGTASALWGWAPVCAVGWSSSGWHPAVGARRWVPNCVLGVAARPWDHRMGEPRWRGWWLRVRGTGCGHIPCQAFLLELLGMYASNQGPAGPGSVPVILCTCVRQLTVHQAQGGGQRCSPLPLWPHPPWPFLPSLQENEQ